ncbi:MAG: aspartyl/asparaginyl beta-hydroxylase domain-containing protein [Acidobacteriota bacterium]|nr:aspartyl/asparaginyl beta-hydroxylase domain-containing protein [Acidobacteriota bacterium]
MPLFTEEQAGAAVEQLYQWGAQNGHSRDSLKRVEDCIRITAGLKKAENKPELQDPEFYFPGLEASAWWEPARFPWHKQLEKLTFIIKMELNALLAGKAPFRRHPDSPVIAEDGIWKQFYLFSDGVPLEENCRAVPQTVQTIRSIPGASEASNVFFAGVTPGTHIKPHWGPYNTRLRCHLGLIIPEGVSIRVGEETRSWQEGKCIFFDDSFDHEVWHRGTSMRYVLILDIWHPDLTRAEIDALKYIRGILVPNEATIENLKNAPVV